MPRDPLRGREILLGVTGSIAAYKAAEIASALRHRGAGVTVLMTPEATEFVGELTFAALSGRRVHARLLDASAAEPEHVSLTEAADALLVAPATANSLAKLACGLADDPVSAAALALKPKAVLVLAPAMNTRMWEHPATRENLERLKRRGALVVPPAEGLLACGTVGIGRMASPERILEMLASTLLGCRKPARRSP